MGYSIGERARAGVARALQNASGTPNSGLPAFVPMSLRSSSVPPAQTLPRRVPFAFTMPTPLPPGPVRGSSVSPVRHRVQEASQHTGRLATPHEQLPCVLSSSPSSIPSGDERAQETYHILLSSVDGQESYRRQRKRPRRSPDNTAHRGPQPRQEATAIEVDRSSNIPSLEQICAAPWPSMNSIRTAHVTDWAHIFLR